MLLKAIPKDLVTEAVHEDPMKVMLMIMVKYQPGSKKEKEALLQQITNPEACWHEERALATLNMWKRRVERARELKLINPDPSVLLSALDTIAEHVIKKNTRKSFRMESARELIRVDVEPTQDAIN